MQSIITLLLLGSIPAIQSIDCNNQDCYEINLESVNLDQGNNAQCYKYSVLLSSEAACNLGSSPKILFGIDTNTCYINTNDLASKITSTTPFAHTIKEDDSNDNIIGIEFDYDATTNPIPNEIIICIQGIPAGSETTTGPIQISDSGPEQCTFGSEDAINFCGICDGDLAETSCFCSNNEDECISSSRPRGDLSCAWDTNNGINDRCIAIDAPECDMNDADPLKPCICFEVAEYCNAISTEGGRTDCQWDDQRELCSPTDCIDEFDCDCFKIEQDCESKTVIDFPQRCVWTENDECIEFDGTTTTEIPTIMPTKAPYYRETSTERPSITTTHVWQKPSKSWGKGDGKGNKGGKGGRKRGGSP